MKLKLSKVTLLLKSPPIIILILIFVFHLFFRFYELESRAQFTWDQVDNAWNAKNIIVNHKLPLIGMPVKQDTGLFIGPLYYYFVALFYFITNLDPIASPIIAGLTSIFTFIVFYYVTLKIFNKWIALIALFIHTFSFYIIEMERIQWPVNFISGFSLLIFYLVYRIINGDYKKIILLGIILGLSFHIHFTSLFYYLIVLFALPFFPRTKKALKHYLLAIPLFIVWFIPTIINAQQSQGTNKTFFDFYYQNSHGLHFRRVLQVLEIEFIEAELILKTQFIPLIKYLLFPIFIITYYFDKKNKYNQKLIYLFAIWIIIPLICLSMFRGDITPYYFSLINPLIIIAVSYLTYFIISKKIFIINLGVIVLALIFIFQNTLSFQNFKLKSLKEIKKSSYEDFVVSRGNEFLYGAPDSYLYYFYEYKYHGKR